MLKEASLESSPSIRSHMDIFRGISLELVKRFLRVSEVFPRSLRSDVNSAQIIGGPATQATIKVVVWVHVHVLLVAIIALPVELSLRLQSSWQFAGSEVINQRRAPEKGHHN